MVAMRVRVVIRLLILLMVMMLIMLEGWQRGNRGMHRWRRARRRESHRLGLRSQSPGLELEDRPVEAYYGSDALIFGALGLQNPKQHLTVVLALLGVGCQHLS